MTNKLAVGALGFLIAGSAKAGAVLPATVLYPLVVPAGFTIVEPARAPQVQVTGATQTVGNGQVASGGLHALCWSSAASSPIDLNPTNLGEFSTTFANATTGSAQVGYGWGAGTNYNPHALLWSGSAGSAVDLTPMAKFGMTRSDATGISGSQQVGQASLPVGYSHAMLWFGSADSAIDLNPTHLQNVNSSIANGTDGIHQVGVGEYYGSGGHALLWSGTADSAVDLSPTNLAGFGATFAVAVSGNQQVGYAYGSDNFTHAMLWAGTADSAVDLQPIQLAGIRNSDAYGTNGQQQVGCGLFGYNFPHIHALAWWGSAASVVDLQNELPASGTWTDSIADTVDNAGDIFGTAQGTFDGVSGTFAVEWAATAVPEPSSMLIIAAALVGTLGLRKRKPGRSWPRISRALTEP
jgi:hypothetical protein